MTLGKKKKIGKKTKLGKKTHLGESVSIRKARSKKDRAGRTRESLFFEPEYKYLAEMVHMDTPQNARKSVRMLLQEYRQAKTEEKKLRIQRAMDVAAKRAVATQLRKNLSEKERKEFEEIAQIYQDGLKRLHWPEIRVKVKGPETIEASSLSRAKSPDAQKQKIKKPATSPSSIRPQKQQQFTYKQDEEHSYLTNVYDNKGHQIATIHGEELILQTTMDPDSIRRIMQEKGLDRIHENNLTITWIEGDKRVGASFDLGDRRKGLSSTFAKIVTKVDTSKDTGYAFEGEFIRNNSMIPANCHLVLVRGTGSWNHKGNDIELYRLKDGVPKLLYKGDWSSHISKTKAVHAIAKKINQSNKQ